MTETPANFTGVRLDSSAGTASADILGLFRRGDCIEVIAERE